MLRSEIRTQARALTELDTADVSDSLLNFFIKEGYVKMIDRERRWPFFEHQTTLVTVANQSAYTGYYNTFREITSITDVSGSGYRLNPIGHDVAEAMFQTRVGITSVNPYYWSSWASTVYIWPQPTSAVSLQVRGYRVPTTWYDADVAQVDADLSLHEPLVYYAVAQLYAMQEDPQMSTFWMQKFDEAVELARADLMRGSGARPLQLSHGVGNFYGPRPQTLSWWNGRR